MADASLYLRLILIGFPFTFIQVSFTVFLFISSFSDMVLQALLSFQQWFGNYGCLSILLLGEIQKQLAKTL